METLLSLWKTIGKDNRTSLFIAAYKLPFMFLVIFLVKPIFIATLPFYMLFFMASCMSFGFSIIDITCCNILIMKSGKKGAQLHNLAGLADFFFTLFIIAIIMIKPSFIKTLKMWLISYGLLYFAYCGLLTWIGNKSNKPINQ